MYQIIAQGSGYLALLLVVLSFQKSRRINILLLMFAGVLLFIIHYCLLRAWTGAVMNVVEAGVLYVSYKKDKSTWAKSTLWLYVFIGVYAVAAALNARTIVSLLPVYAQMIGAVAVWQTNPRLIRIIMLMPRPLWFIYNFTVGSQAGMAAEVFIFTSVLSSIVRFDLKKTKYS
jgi:Bacterial inner membrane protein